VKKNKKDEATPVRKKMSIAELEALLKQDDEIELEILPNGEIVARGEKIATGTLKPLTMRENLGGEYGCRI